MKADQALADEKRLLAAAGGRRGAVVGAASSPVRRPRGPARATVRDEAAARSVERRVRREPLAYVLGEWGFRRARPGGSTGARSSLGPRRRSWSSGAWHFCPDWNGPRVLDVGVGSGATRGGDRRRGAGRARDRGATPSPDALALAREKRRPALGRRLSCEGGFEAAAEGGTSSSPNPPYVLPDEIDQLEPEVRDWEPRGALVGEGLHDQLAAVARTEWLVLEAAPTQTRTASALERPASKDARSRPIHAAVAGGRGRRPRARSRRDRRAARRRGGAPGRRTPSTALRRCVRARDALGGAQGPRPEPTSSRCCSRTSRRRSRGSRRLERARGLPGRSRSSRTESARVPELPDETRAVVAAVGAVLATSANLARRPATGRLEDVPLEIRAACGAEIDGGELPAAFHGRRRDRPRAARTAGGRRHDRGGARPTRLVPSTCSGGRPGDLRAAAQRSASRPSTPRSRSCWGASSSGSATRSS